jgi:hypothetical protein
MYSSVISVMGLLSTRKGLGELRENAPESVEPTAAEPLRPLGLHVLDDGADRGDQVPALARKPDDARALIALVPLEGEVPAPLEMADEAIRRLLGHLPARRDLRRSHPVGRGVLEDVEVGRPDVVVPRCDQSFLHARAYGLKRHPQERRDQRVA